MMTGTLIYFLKSLVLDACSQPKCMSSETQSPALENMVRKVTAARTETILHVGGTLV